MVANSPYSDALRAYCSAVHFRDADAIARAAVKLDAICGFDRVFPPPADSWRDPASAPKNIVWTNDGDQYGPYILATTTNGDVRRVRWWQYRGDPACNFLGDCGNACRITAWMPLPKPYGQ